MMDRSITGRRFIIHVFLLVLLALLMGAAVEGTLTSEVSILLRIKAALGNTQGAVLSTWDESIPLCQWRNIQWTFTNGSLLNCTSSSSYNNFFFAEDSTVAVYGLSLAAVGLNGSLSEEMGKLSFLKKLDLSSNKLTGGIPLDLGNSPSIEFLYLSKNNLTGALPTSLWNLCGQLIELHLDHNALTGIIPSLPGASIDCKFLSTLDMSSNKLTGSIPLFLGGFQSLSMLNLSNNRLSGGIPQQLTGLKNLTNLDVAYNDLTGNVPVFAGTVTVNTEGNDLQCAAGACSRTDKNSSRMGLNPRLVAGLVIASLAASVVLLAISVSWGHKHNWGQQLKHWNGKQRKLQLEDDVGGGKLVRFEGGEHLTVEEVLNAPGEVLGKSSYGTVYKAKLSGGGMIALRLLREDTVKERLYFVPAIQQLGLIRYPNIVSLLAYYAGPQGEKLLVYNYLSRGSLADLLHDRRNASRIPLTWAQRHKIVLGAARGLAYLHHGLQQHHQDLHHGHIIIHGNLKSKNIMVDESFEGHLADYGLPMLMNSAAQKAMLNATASQGYRSPETSSVNNSKAKFSTSMDVYNFGIVLLEILTGKRPKETGEAVVTDLPTMVKSAVVEERTADLFDMEMLNAHGGGGGGFVVEDGLLQTLQLAMGCCAPSLSRRPSIKEVVRQLEIIKPKIPTPLYTPTGLKTPRDFT